MHQLAKSNASDVLLPDAHYQAEMLRLLMQLRRKGVTDTHVLGAMEAIPRHAFIPKAFLPQAYDDSALPILSGQTISQPSVVGYMTQALEVKERMRVLEVGTGSGYQAAVLSKLCRMVYSIERHANMLEPAREILKSLDLHNILTRHGDGSKGWPEAAPFERIIVTCSSGAHVPQALLDQLSPDGILVIPVKYSSREVLLRIRRIGAGDRFETEELQGVRFVPLVEG